MELLEVDLKALLGDQSPSEILYYLEPLVIAMTPIELTTPSYYNRVEVGVGRIVKTTIVVPGERNRVDIVGYGVARGLSEPFQFHMPLIRSVQGDCPKAASRISVSTRRKMAIPPVLLPRTTRTLSVTPIIVKARGGRFRSMAYQFRAYPLMK